MFRDMKDYPGFLVDDREKHRMLVTITAHYKAGIAQNISDEGGPRVVLVPYKPLLVAAKQHVPIPPAAPSKEPAGGAIVGFLSPNQGKGAVPLHLQLRIHLPALGEVFLRGAPGLQAVEVKVDQLGAL